MSIWGAGRAADAAASTTGSEEALGSYSPSPPSSDGVPRRPHLPRMRGPSPARVLTPPRPPPAPPRMMLLRQEVGSTGGGRGLYKSLHPPSLGMEQARPRAGQPRGWFRVPLGRISCMEIHTHTSTACKFPAKDEDITNSEPWFHTCDLLNLPHSPARWPLFSYFTDERSEAYQQGYVISPTPYI